MIMDHDAFKWEYGEFLVVQWLGLQALTAEGPGSIYGSGPKIPKPSSMPKYIHIHIYIYIVANIYISD